MAEPDTTADTPPEPPAPARVMSIHAHPDDQEFSVGGTLAKWAQAGSQIVTVCITRGQAGTNSRVAPPKSREALAAVREEEQRNACRVLGVQEVVFLDYMDGELQPSIALRRDLTRLISTFAIVKSDMSIYEDILSDTDLVRGLEANDPASLAKWTRKMEGAMGAPAVGRMIRHTT